MGRCRRLGPLKVNGAGVGLALMDQARCSHRQAGINDAEKIAKDIGAKAESPTLARAASISRAKHSLELASCAYRANSNLRVPRDR